MSRYRTDDLFAGREELLLLLNFGTVQSIEDFYDCAYFHPPATLPLVAKVAPIYAKRAPSQLAFDHLMCLTNKRAQSALRAGGDAAPQS